METTQIEKIVKAKLELMKNQSMNPVVKKSKKEPQKYNVIYDECCELRDRIRVHSELNYIPEKLLRTKAPYEDQSQFEWRKANIQPVTMPYFMRAMSTINRIFNKSNYTIKYEDEKQGKYFNSELPIFGSIDNYAEQIVITNKICDPNGVVAIKPFLLPLKQEITEDAKGAPVVNYIFDDSKEIDAVPVVYGCEQVIDYVEGNYLFVLTEEKSPVAFGNKMVNEGLVFEFYDENTIYKIKQVGKKVDFEFSQPEIYYPHNLGKLPVQKLKGIPKTKGTAVLYYSYFIYAIPNLDLAYYGSSNLDMSIVSHMFPQKFEYVDRCENASCGGRGYTVEFIDNKETHKLCGDCNGTGNKLKTGPMNVKTIHTPDPMVDPSGSSQVPTPPMGFVDPPTGSLELAWRKVNSDLENAFAHLHMNISPTNVQGGSNDTAKGKEIDREELFSFLLRISNEVFGLMGFIIDMAGKMRYAGEWKGATVSPPQNFSMVSVGDLSEEMKSVKDSSIPDVVAREILREYTNKRFPQSSDVRKVFDIVEYCDRFVQCDNLAIAGKLATGTAAKWEAILHDSIVTFIVQECKKSDKFIDQDFDKIKTDLIKIAQAKAEEINPTINVKDGLAAIAEGGGKSSE